MKYTIEVRDTGDILLECDTLEEARETVKEWIEGDKRQEELMGNLNPNRDDYFEVLRATEDFYQIYEVEESGSRQNMGVILFSY